MTHCLLHYQKKIDKQTTLKTNVEIPVKNIESVEVERTDVLATVLSGLGIVVGALILGVLIVQPDIP